MGFRVTFMVVLEPWSACRNRYGGGGAWRLAGMEFERCGPK